MSRMFDMLRAMDGFIGNDNGGADEDAQADWPIVDESDPLGVTHYTPEPWSGRGGGVAVMVRREKCKPWRLGVYPTLDAAQWAVDEWIAARRAEREQASESL